MNPKNIGAFFDFDETLLDIESSRLGFRYLWERRLVSRVFILKILTVNFFCIIAIGFRMISYLQIDKYEMRSAPGPLTKIPNDKFIMAQLN